MSLIAPYKSHVSGDAKLTMEEAARYICHWKRWEEFISEKTLNKIIPTVFCRDVIGIHYVPAVRQGVHYLPVGNNYMEENYEREEVLPSFRFEEWKGEWRRDVYCPAIGYRVPYEYQSVELNNVWKQCLIEDYPYLADYTFEAYCPRYNELIEIYVKIHYQDNGEDKVCSVYTPVQALKEHNANLIVERHTKYHTWYSQKEEWHKANLPVLESEEFKKFAELVNNYKKEE